MAKVNIVPCPHCEKQLLKVLVDDDGMNKLMEGNVELNHSPPYATCFHCGKQARMRVVSGSSSTFEIDQDQY